MSTGDLTENHSSSLRVGVSIRTSESQERPDPTQIPLPPSETGSIPENKTNVSGASLPGSEQKVDEEKKPTLMESWEKVLKEVARHDEDMVKGWRDDIDTLLVFAGLFSAVVTAFVIESYQWLDEDPADTTVALLTQLISVQVNGSQSAFLEPTQFKPDASSIRINVFWFLSLIFSLTSALFGLLCKQWVREHQRDTMTRTPGEALALRQLRRDSLEKWKVPSFLSALPILLEIALLFFFVGVLDLLWSRHLVPFTVCLVAISFSAGLYFLTALLPTLMVPRDQKSDIVNRHFDRLSYQLICPYKSPQAWLVYRLSRTLLRPFLKISAINNFLHQNARRFWDHITSPASDWSSFDLWVVRQFDQHVWLPLYEDSFDLKVYELRAFEWAVAIFRDSPTMIPHLRNILATIPPSVALSAVLGRWGRTIWKAVSMEDVEYGLKHPDPYPWDLPNPNIRRPVLQYPEGISLLFRHQYWVTMAKFSQHDVLSMLSDNARLQHSTGLHFIIPFPVVDALWTRRNPISDVENSALLSLFEQGWSSWETFPGYDGERHNAERVALVQALADHINRTDCVSALLTSKRGQEFVSFIHNEIGTRQWLYSGDTWHQAVNRVREVGGLSSDYFSPLLQLPLDESLSMLPIVRYSIEAESEIQINVVDIVTSDGAFEADPTEGGHVRHPQDFNVDDNVNTSLGGQVIGSLDEEHESGAGQPTVNQEDFVAEDDGQRLERGEDMRDLGKGKGTDDRIRGNPSGNGKDDEIGDSYNLRSLSRRISN